MSTAQLKAIAIGVFVLLLVWAASEIVSRRPPPAADTIHLPRLAASDVDTVTIVHGTDSVVLAKRTPTGWTVNGFAAATDGVKDLLAALGDSARPELVAQSPSSFARMGVDTGGGRVVRASARGKTLARLIVGGTGSAFDAFYVRLPGDTHVYQWHGRLATLASRSVNEWRDRTVAAVPPDSIAEVEIRRGATHFVLRKRGARWMLPGGGTADSATAARLVEAFRTITAAGFATPRQADSLRSARMRRSVVVRGAGGRELVALAFDSTAAGFWVRREGTVYRLDAWLVDQLTPRPDAFQPAPRAH